MKKDKRETENLEKEKEIVESVDNEVEKEVTASNSQNSMEGELSVDDELSVEDKLKEEVSMANDKYLRLAAEFDNYRKRTLKEKQDLILFAGEEVIKGILPVLDDFERALEMLEKAEGDNSTAIEGTELIYSKLKTFLTSKGVKEIEAVGCDLDTDFHEAVAQIPVKEKKKKNKIVEVVQRGYTLNEKVIRFSKVVIGQ
ncbi:MAG: nucleotide exchange factor GrpE [Bacteroidales bacterium]|nr:nucleotide exchange factor GrpE [Bacteroidales bacterium]MDD4656969.1 nucleotide exchange factor GrpE [Bacteroidales bacterium]